MSRDSKYLNLTPPTFMDLSSHPCVKVFLIDDVEHFKELQISQREKNTLYQWYRLKKLYECLPNEEYDWYVRLRPDIRLEISKEALLEAISSLEKGHLYIPEGNDIFDASFLREGPVHPLNDQIAILPKEMLAAYCNTFDSIDRTDRPIVSEYILAKHLSKHQIVVRRFLLPYSLSLSLCKVLAIAGDSGSGKSTIVKAIESIFPFDSSVLLETDRYHKWERTDDHWNTMTHLHPETNHLEKLLDDTYKLKLGHDIFSVDYDHSTGKFTEPQKIESKEIVLLCGLHTLYQGRLRDHIDIKIYIDTQEELKTFWKLQRDILHRQYTREQVLTKIQKRQTDFESYILPQKNHANIIVRYSTSKENLFNLHKVLVESDLSFELEIKHSFFSHCFLLLHSFSESCERIPNEYFLCKIRQGISKEAICKVLQKESIVFDETKILDGYLGVLQALTLRLFFVSQ
jgi:uridine kinase